MSEQKLLIEHFGYKDIKGRCPKKYENASIHDLEFSTQQQKKIMDWCKGSENFLIYLGRAGCGKTHFCFALIKFIYDYFTCKEEKPIYKTKIITNSKGAYLGEEKTHEIEGKKIIFHHPKKIAYYNIGDLFDLFKECYSKKESDIKIKDLLKNCDYLFIDDFGATANTDWQVQCMYEIIDYRYSEMKPTVITSNLTFDGIEKSFHQRLRSRLEAKENLYLFDWESDYRLKE